VNGNGTKPVVWKQKPPLNIVEVLLVDSPYAYRPWPHDGQSVSDRDRMVQRAANWSRNPSLTDDERARISAVWLDHTPQPAVAVTTQRSNELWALLKGSER
jgi:hypothetical protein